MKLSLRSLALAFGALNTVSAFTETYSCYNKKCTGACIPSNGGRDGTPTEVQWGEGQAWCYIRKTGKKPGSDPAPIVCLDGVGCEQPASGAACMTKDWDENMGGCSV